MRLLADWPIVHQGRQRAIQLFQGDLAHLPPEHAVDLLVVSAFPNDYTPVPGTLIAALQNAGVSVQQLSQHKHLDLRDEFSCWISHPIPEAPGFHRILCLESGARGTPPEITDDIFRALAPASIADFSEASIAMPLIGAGNQGYPVARMTSAILTAAHFWLRRGLNIRTIKIVVKSDATAATALQVFQEVRRAVERLPQDRNIDFPQLAIPSPPQPMPSASPVPAVVPESLREQARPPASASPFSLPPHASAPPPSAPPAPAHAHAHAHAAPRSGIFEAILSALTLPFQSKPQATPPPPPASAPPPPPRDTSSMTMSGTGGMLPSSVVEEILARKPRSEEEFNRLLAAAREKKVAQDALAQHAAPNQPREGRGASPHPPAPPSAQPPAAPAPTCDIFLSYSHKDADAAEALRQQILRTVPNARIFFDKESLHTGGSWLMEIAESLDGARRVAALYTPNYWASKFCKDEFTAALLRQNDTGRQILFPIYFQETNIPYFFRSLQHLDCREADLAKLTEACNELCKDLD